MMKDDFILVQLWGSHVLCSRTFSKLRACSCCSSLVFLTFQLKGHLPQNLVWEGRVGYESCEKSFQSGSWYLGSEGKQSVSGLKSYPLT